MLIVVYQPARVFKAIFLFEGYLLLHKYIFLGSLNCACVGPSP